LLQIGAVADVAWYQILQMATHVSPEEEVHAKDLTIVEVEVLLLEEVQVVGVQQEVEALLLEVQVAAAV